MTALFIVKNGYLPFEREATRDSDQRGSGGGGGVGEELCHELKAATQQPQCELQ